MMIARAGGPGGEVAFLAEDVDAEAASLRAAGAEILAGPTDRPWGHRTLHLLRLPEKVERDLGRPVGLRIDVGFASHVLKLAGPAGDHSHRWAGEHG